MRTRRKLSDSQIADICDKFILRFPDWCAESLSIRNKLGATVPLRLSPAQAKLHQVVRRQEDRGVPVRVQVLKARQVHMSVGAAAACFSRVAFMEGQKAVVVAHSHKSAGEIWGYYDQFCQGYQVERGGLHLLGLESRHEGKLLKFAGGGYVQVYSADNVSIGRGSSLRILHFSEGAFWRDASSVMTGMLQAVPDDPGTMIIDESTANGMGGPFYDRYLRIISGEQGDWVFMFFAWFEHPEYVRPLQVGRTQFQDSMTQEEHDLMRLHRLSFEQVNWRRWAIRNKCEGSIDRFHQEYPSTPEEAFVASGRPRFDMISLGAMPVIRDPLEGGLERIRVGTRAKIVFEPRERGELKVWRRPVAGHNYVIGADTSEGIDTSEAIGSGDPDFSSATILERETGEQCAALRARMEPSAFGDYLCALGEWFNWAFLVPEANNTGLATIEEILRQGYPLHLVYTRRRDPHDRRPPLLQEIGWKTTSVTRPDLIHRLDTALRERAIYIHDAVTVQECRSFVIHPNGKAAAAHGSHDDTVISCALAVVGLGTAPRRAPDEPVRQGVQVGRPDLRPINYRFGGRNQDLEDRF